MSDTNRSGGSNSGLAFIVGGLLIAVVVIAVVLFSGGYIQTPAPAGGGTNISRSVNVTVPKVEAPKIEVPAPPPVVAAPADAPANP